MSTDVDLVRDNHHKTFYMAITYEGFLEPLGCPSPIFSSLFHPKQYTERLQAATLRLTNYSAIGFWTEQVLFFRQCFILCFKFSTQGGKGEKGVGRENR